MNWRICGLLLPLILVLAAGVGAQDKPPTIKQIMGKVNKGPNSLCPTIGKALRADEPQWDDIQKETKELAALAAVLGKNSPPKGEQASWDDLAKVYASNAKALDDAAQKKDKTAAQAAFQRLADMKNCNACHNAHRP
ncbi:MAG: cytochrome c [Gemmataceae bacterium]|nr:cytochrome c [Gemmataceae bacterium]